MRGRVLIVEDDRSMCEILELGLGRRGFKATSCTAGLEAIALLETEEYDVVVTDLNMRGVNGIELCERVTSNRPDIPVIVITAFGSLETAIAAIRAGAYDFITKPFELEALSLSLDRAVQFRGLREEVRRLRLAVASAQRLDELIGESPPMKKLFDLITRVADSDASVLVSGETGTGKELVARALHRLSRRSKGLFVPLSCAVLPEALLEAELFGHTKGAFTDARTARQGLFLQASGGTLFLDEIGEMPLGLQPKLLRALQERMVRPLGSDTEIASDVRFIAATNRDLEAAILEGSFRSDLLYRINVIHLELPPLRARGGDILLLAQHFMTLASARSGRRVVGIASPAAEKLLGYSWPGNVRELQNCIEHAVALTRFDHIGVEDLPQKVSSYSSVRLPLVSDDPADLPPMEEVERRYIARVLEAMGGNKTLAAQVLGFDRKTLYRKLERFAMAASDEQSV